MSSGASASAARRASGSTTLTPASQLAMGSWSSRRSVGSSSQASGRDATSATGASNRTEAAECSAGLPGPASAATTSRRTPRSWVRISSAVANRSAGSSAHALASRR
ncbi:Uncharacterised protein [Mycobacteroides abscessus]|nr:Uncharacterised protein [Mycobacteroides abscessus]